jgi:hypothetical protein
MKPAALLDQLRASILHRNIAARAAKFGWRDWPTQEQLNEQLAATCVNSAGQRMRFSYSAGAGDEGAAAYETEINRSAVIPLRPLSWHDLFNALMWIAFPLTKSSLNAIHRRELLCQQGGARSARRDAVTLLDECGIVLVVDDYDWTRMHEEHDWHELLVANREDWGRRIKPMNLGHGLLEQCLTPYIGLTGKALHLKMPADWFELPEDEQRHAVDDSLSKAIINDQCVLSTHELLPLPILGIPGWWPDNELPSFYSNRDYFRPARS